MLSPVSTLNWYLKYNSIFFSFLYKENIKTGWLFQIKKAAFAKTPAFITVLSLVESLLLFQIVLFFQYYSTHFLCHEPTPEVVSSCSLGSEDFCIE